MVSGSTDERGSRALGSSKVLLGLCKTGDILKKKKKRRWGKGVLKNTEQSTRERVRNQGALAVEVEGRWVESRGSGLTAVGDLERGAAEALNEVGEEGWVC